jgi:transcriptional regulator with XRE-family HTH domain
VPRSIHTPAQQRLSQMLREERTTRGVLQVDLARRLDRHQSYVSKYESGERRLDLIELGEIADALGFDLAKFVRRFRSI